MTRTSSPRLLSVDVLRGVTIVGMILVNNPGDWRTVYWPLLHAEWHGWTPTDLIFPFFLFIVGASIALALGHRVEAGTARAAIVSKIVRRSAVLFALGLFLSGFPFGLFGPRSFGRLLETWRIPGVLQRIAICYLIAALMFLVCRKRTLVAWTAVFLVGYWLVMIWVPIPAPGGGWTAPDLDSQSDHLAGWIDRSLLGDHAWISSKVYDPEGLLSTIPALATTLFGVFAGMLVRRRGTDLSEPALRLFVFGTLLTGLGHVWSWVLPINKALWTSSYAVFTAGLAFTALALAIYILDLRGHRRAARPLVLYGQNAITVFVGSGVLARTLAYVRVGDASLQRLIYTGGFASWLPPYAASFAYAVSWVLGWYAVLWYMDRRGIVLRA